MSVPGGSFGPTYFGPTFSGASMCRRANTSSMVARPRCFISFVLASEVAQ